MNDLLENLKFSSTKKHEEKFWFFFVNFVSLRGRLF